MLRCEPDEDVQQVLRVVWRGTSAAPADEAIRSRPGGARYALLPRPGAVTALVPTWPPSITAAVVRNYITPTSRAARMRAAALYALARLGLFAIWPCSPRVRRAADGSGLIDHLAQLLGREVIVAVHLGPRRVNRKPVLQLISADGALVAYVKVGINEFTSRRVAHEAAALAQLERVSLGAITVPEVLAEGTWHGSSFLVLAPVPTKSDVVSAPDRRTAAMAELSRSFGVKTTRLVDADWWRDIENGLAAAGGPEASRLTALGARIAAHCGGNALELGAAHGDWAPWNMADVEGQVVVWDWERFRRGVPIGWDAVHYAAELHRHSGARDGAGLTRMIPEVATITRDCGSVTNDPNLVFATYLLDLGWRYLRDGKTTGVQPRGPISDWLLDPLTELVRALTTGSKS